MTTATGRIYLDHAATSFPKPPSVGDAVLRYMQELGTAPGRTTSRQGMEVQRVIDRCRQRLAKLFGAPGPDHVIFTLNGTDSLNLAIHGLVRPGDRVVTTVWEHNSVLRPLHHASREKSVITSFAPATSSGLTEIGEFQRLLEASPRLVILNHASNVTGVIQPVAEMSRLARQAGAIVLLDAAQTAGAISVTFDETGADLIACPGHKGLQGPLGTGVLLLNRGLDVELQPVRQGGTGTTSESPAQPMALPDRYEAGNLNAPGLFGLEAALAVRDEQPESQCRRLTSHLIAGLQTMPGVTVHTADPDVQRVAVVSVSFERVTPHVVATLLDEHFGIETRAGLHCAPQAHRALGTLEEGGTVRFSLGPTTTGDEIDLTLTAIAEILAAL